MVWTEVTTGRPTVSVPVLSSTRVSTGAKFSSASPSLTRTPCLAMLPRPATAATGTEDDEGTGAGDDEEGQCEGKVPRPGEDDDRDDDDGGRVELGEALEEALTRGPRLLGLLDQLDDPGEGRLVADVVGLDLEVAGLGDGAGERGPRLLRTGTDSPVMEASVTDAVPDATMPSTAIRSPLVTMTVSPTSTSSASTVTRSPSRTTVARRGEVDELAQGRTGALEAARLEPRAEEEEERDDGGLDVLTDDERPDDRDRDEEVDAEGLGAQGRPRTDRDGSRQDAGHDEGHVSPDRPDRGGELRRPQRQNEEHA